MITHFLIFHIASGQSLFSGAVCLIVAVCLSGWKTRRTVRIARNVLVYLAGSLVSVSATPFATGIYVVLLVGSILWLVIEALDKSIPARIVVGLRSVVVRFWIAAMILELPYHFQPRIPRLDHPTLGIVADSLTAGMGDEKVGTWPEIFAKRHRIVVRDHSIRGATVRSALKQAVELAPDERLVLLEIGGNDLLGHSTPEEFETGLRKLLSVVRRPGRVVVMFELPLPPTYNAFGQIQRRLSREYHVLLIPKRVLLGVLQQDDSTLDSIHLSPKGHQVMAEEVWRVVRPAYEKETGELRGEP